MQAPGATLIDASTDRIVSGSRPLWAREQYPRCPRLRKGLIHDFRSSWPKPERPSTARPRPRPIGVLGFGTEPAEARQRGTTAVPAGGPDPRTSTERPWARPGIRARTANSTAVTLRTAPNCEGNPPGDFQTSHRTVGANATMAVRIRSLPLGRLTPGNRNARRNSSPSRSLPPDASTWRLVVTASTDLTVLVRCLSGQDVMYPAPSWLRYPLIHDFRGSETDFEVAVHSPSTKPPSKAAPGPVKPLPAISPRERLAARSTGPSSPRTAVRRLPVPRDARPGRAGPPRRRRRVP